MKVQMTVTLLAMLVALIACGKSEEKAAPTGGGAKTAEPTAKDLLNKAADAVTKLKSTQFMLKREGAPAVLDEKTGITFTEATCRYKAPDRVSCAVKISLKNGTVLNMEKVWVPEGAFMTNPLTKKYMVAPPEATFNGVSLFTQTGIPNILRNDVQKPEIVGKEKVEEYDTIHLKGVVDGAKLNPIMADTMKPGVLYPCDLWMDVKSSQIVKIFVKEPEGNTWTINLFGMDEPQDVQTPVVPGAPGAAGAAPAAATPAAAAPAPAKAP